MERVSSGLIGSLLAVGCRNVRNGFNIVEGGEVDSPEPEKPRGDSRADVVSDIPLVDIVVGPLHISAL
jgi:hypothetical protein